MRAKVILSFLMLFAVNHLLIAQTLDDTVSIQKEKKLIVKNDGTEYIGYILSDDGRELLIETDALGKIYIPKSEIRSITTLDSGDFKKSGEYDPTGPFATRYYFTNTALPAKKGDHYTMIHLYGPEVHFAAGKGFNIGIMTSWAASPFILVARQSIRTKAEKVRLSVGTMVGSSGYFNTFRGYGAMHWGTITVGDSKNNFSLSGGYLYLQPGFEDQSTVVADDGIYSELLYYSTDLEAPRPSKLFKTPMFSVAGIVRLNSKISFIFDSMFSVRKPDKKVMNYGFTDTNGNGYQDYGEGYYEVRQAKGLTTMFFLMPGMRIQGSDKNAFQVALAGVTYIHDGQTTAFPVPQCSWFIKF